ncbi:hypothetical protein [Roseiconus lacunae]|uniref:DUF2004 domain-containing protein n=1 Tax=Roseiconus lacunae TaxID=2605694 RepID=A0ABT7PHV4_9BACT|nr:hypothetical protein [Roseiconus lacunae]MDM4015908.1 hypothetical protein [Roseiconus lacunae]
MWPFSINKKAKPVPAVRCGDIDVTWNSEFLWWEFSSGDIDYSLTDNPVFDTSLLPELPKVAKWLVDLRSEIDDEIEKHLEGWCDWNGKKDLMGIDVSWLVSKGEVDVSYAHEDWADLGVNIVITDGKITHSYAAD